MAFLLESFLRIEAKFKIYPNEIQRNQSANNFLSLKGAVTQEATAPSRALTKAENNNARLIIQSNFSATANKRSIINSFKLVKRSLKLL